MRPLPDQTQASTALRGDLLTVLLAPHDDLGAFGGRARTSAPRMVVGDLSTTILALVIHELATNSLKHGTLSLGTGTHDVSCTAQGDAITIVWTMNGGPAVTMPTAPAGYGCTLVHRSVTGHHNGSVDDNWATHRLVVKQRLSPDRVSQ
ncbi:hypothetical protein SAMN04488003_103192 [Loktanella fryxellensis]|uniref:histidine kinase n=1 Tax=Loktanella fryxellensis TaxID=245187 RepID=A0A1H8ALK8_9RHOB|nr:hypothetical protein [Loktanella fryxellensis]SEM70718.1 hypothetical protein SAMN04488003_103192 [Loktanella fryxellensis]